MSRLLDVFETVITPSYRLFGLVDATVDTYSPNADRANWLLSAPGMVYLQVPLQVIQASVRLESWSTTPPENSAQWSGTEEVQVEFPGGDLALETIDCGQEEVPLILPSPGLYRMRWQWIFNRERGPFTSPLEGRRDPLLMSSGHEGELNGKDQYCLVQIWRITASDETG
ncbi:hypothetical protein [Streptomyces sp. NPDC056821]|uniref:hypothetical protein n=1 Tax=unclassified Streptomyces TaxID=2593676 RepID=UPI0036BB6D90